MAKKEKDKDKDVEDTERALEALDVALKLITEHSCANYEYKKLLALARIETLTAELR